ncbi:MAG: hypothetical protein MAG453_01220 [Calditrichaeota bacterium]|nr:hypothetical protein [Calditrichota bacterium]
MMHPSVESSRELVPVEHFMNLSAEINYHLSAEVPREQALLALVAGPARLEFEEPLRLAMRIIRLGYADTRRKIGPLAVLHPLRTASLLARCMPHPDILDLLGAMLHDKHEDLPQEAVPEQNRDEFDRLFNLLLENIGAEHQWYLGERLALLTREPRMTYHEYLVRLLDQSDRMPDLLHVKLADRLDNTLDHHIHRPGVLRYNFYRNLFDLLFVSVYRGVNIRQYHFLPEPEEGALLLAQLFKNALFLSLMRVLKRDRIDETSRRLFDAIAIASIREAQWLALELIASVGQDKLPELRRRIVETMDYCYHGGATQVHEASVGPGVAGVFLERFTYALGEDRRNAMIELYRDKDYLATVIITFIATFSAFLNDSEFALEGIDREGVHAVGVWTPRS